jgi:hypothetical protein
MAPDITIISYDAHNNQKQDVKSVPETCHPSLLRRPASQHLLVALIVLATAAQYANSGRYLGRYLSEDNWMVLVDRPPNATNGVSSQNKHCVNVDNMTCAIHDENHPDWMNECNQSPDLPQCQLGCYDAAPDAYQHTALRESQVDAASSNLMSDPFHSLWPPIDQGEWIEDHEYCLAHANTTRNCFLDKYRFDLQVQGRKNFETRSGQQACNLLHNHNISDISLLGDSLIRHLAMGLILVLNDDWNRNFDPRRKDCSGDYAFQEKGCRMSLFDMQVCHDPETGRTIHFTFQQHNPRKENTLLLFCREGARAERFTFMELGITPPPDDTRMRNDWEY